LLNVRSPPAITSKARRPFEIETDKATIELESPADAYVKQVLVTISQNYRVGTPLLILGEKDEQISEDYIRH